MIDVLTQVPDCKEWKKIQKSYIFATFGMFGVSVTQLQLIDQE